MRDRRACREFVMRIRSIEGGKNEIFLFFWRRRKSEERIGRRASFVSAERGLKMHVGRAFDLHVQRDYA